MIRYFNRNETNFDHNETILTPISCYVNEEANGLYELEAEFAKIVNVNDGDIIKAPSPRGEQLFRIYRIKKSLKGKTVYAKHIFYDLSKNFLVNVELNNISGFTAINSVLDDCETSHNFTATSNVLSQNSVTYSRINPVQAIIGDDNSILNLWGGNLIRDNFNIDIQAEGIDRGYEIRLGKNLIGIDADIDESSVKTRVYPTVTLGDDDTVYSLPEKYIDSPYLSNYGEPIIYTEEIKLTNEQKNLPIEEIYDIMRDYCNNLFVIDNIDKPVVNYKVDFVELSKTEQYKDLAILEQLDLYDIVTVKVSHLDIDVKARVIKYKYDCLIERYESIELGDFSAISNYKTENIVKQLRGSIQVNKTAVEYATDVITGNKGGYVVFRRYPDGKPYEILIMETEDINTPHQNVLRMNNSGLGFSQDGYNGTYGTAITIDGHIVADYVDTGTLTSILLKSDNYIPNIRGTQINLADGTIDSKNFKVDANGNLTGNNAILNNGTFNGSITGGSMNINDKFKVDANGVLTAIDGNFSGNIIGSTLISQGSLPYRKIYIGEGIVDIGDTLNNYIEMDGSEITFCHNNGDGTTQVATTLQYGYVGASLISGTDMTCLRLNNGTPITSLNISSQSVNHATSASNLTNGSNFAYVSSNDNLIPSNSVMCVGSSLNKWNSLYANNVYNSAGIITSSDERLKNSFAVIDDRYIKLLDNITPYIFKYNNSSSNRFHTGMKAQDAESLLLSVELTTQDFAALVKDPIYKNIKEDGEYDTLSEIVDYQYYLRYEEFIPLLIEKSHRNNAEIASLKETIQEQQNKINSFEERLSKLEVA